MPIFQHILVPTDFGEPAERAVEMAITLATTFGSRLTLLHVFADPSSPYGIPYPLRSELAVYAGEALAAAVAKVEQRFPKVESALRAGVHWEEILGAVQTQGIDLVVMGTHGRGGIAHALLGSVTERVVHACPVPVLTIRASP